MVVRLLVPSGYGCLPALDVIAAGYWIYPDISEQTMFRINWVICTFQLQSHAFISARQQCFWDVFWPYSTVHDDGAAAEMATKSALDVAERN